MATAPTSDTTISKVSDDRLTWEVFNRTLNGTPQPSLDKIEISRVKGNQAMKTRILRVLTMLTTLVFFIEFTAVAAARGGGSRRRWWRPRRWRWRWWRAQLFRRWRR